jgi:hypothetical protein
MTTSVLGIYSQGKIELLELPIGLREGRVQIVLTEAEELPSTPQYLQYGKYRSIPDTTPEDFKEAEWQQPCF